MFLFTSLFFSLFPSGEVENILDILKLLVILFSAVVPHEVAHGWVAYKLGDPTAKNAGRLTLNPLKHIDPVGTIILPGILLVLMLMGMNRFLFGWAKPVPVNFTRLRHPKRDMMLVGIAGPVVNVILAAAFSQLLRFDLSLANREVVESAVYLNLLLAIFNMIPIPPLDGSRFVTGLLPDKLAILYLRLEPYGILIVFVLLYLGLFRHIVLPVTDFCAKLLGIVMP